MSVADLLGFHMSDYLQEMVMFCNKTVLSLPPPDDGVYCPAVIDEWGLCFNYTKAGSIAYLPCPSFTISNPDGVSFRRCEADGTWQVFSHGRPWTNLSACVHNITTFPEEEFHQAVSYIYLYIAVASISLFLLVLSLAIFCGFRQLRCDRITIHKNLFVSYILTALCWILYYRLAVLDGLVLLKNPVWCQLLHVLGQAFTATNFSWMFCEGLYLHIIMAHALRTGKRLIKCLVIAGWVVPLIIAAIYGIVRWATASRTNFCWKDDHALMWIFGGPIAVSAIVNVGILINVVRLLMTKLRQIPDASQSKKAAKATLILVPLFGLQFIMFPFQPEPGSEMYPVFLHTMAFLHSSQGTMVSVIFCFCNGEVRSLIRRKLIQHEIIYGSRRKTTGITSSTFVDGYSVVDSTREGNHLRTKNIPDNHHKNVELLEMKGSPMVTTPLVSKENPAETTTNHIDEGN